MLLAPPDPAILARRDSIIAGLKQIVPDGVVETPTDLTAYESDALASYQQRPLVVVLPRTGEEVAQIIRYAVKAQVPIVPRGAGTSLSGGALPRPDGILIGMGRMSRILEIDYDNRCVTLQPGVTNAAITRAVEAGGFYYAPDPSSQIACTIGGNIAENSGGLHCLKYGLTTNNLMGVKFVLPDGEMITLGGKAPGSAGIDLMGLITGSEGLLGMVVEATVRIIRKAPVTRTMLASFDSVPDAGACVAAIIGDGIVPAAMEFMDRATIGAVEAYNAPGYPDAEAILIIDADGVEADVADDFARIKTHVTACRGQLREATETRARAKMWAGRKAAFSAMGRLQPDMICMDGTIPRHALPKVLEGIADLSRRHGLACCNVFHAGDGNLHPLIIFDAMKQGELAVAEEFGNDILRLCVEVGGVLTGEHGVGVEKRDLMTEMFTTADLDQQHRIKCAFDIGGLFNPGKVFPTLSACVEQGHMHVHGAKLPHPHLPRF
jgi:glycolate oxidase